MPKTKHVSIREGLADAKERGRSIYPGPFEAKQVDDGLEITNPSDEKFIVHKGDHISGGTVLNEWRTGGYVTTIGPDYLYIKLGARTFPISFNNVNPHKNFIYIVHEIKNKTDIEKPIEEPMEKNTKKKTEKKNQKIKEVPVKLTMPKNYAKLSDGTIKSFRHPSDLKIFMERPKNKDRVIESSLNIN